MRGIADWETGEIHEAPRNGLPLLRQKSVGFVRDVMTDPTWTKLVVVREPAERLASGFVQKCYATGATASQKEQYSNCPYLKLFPEASILSRSLWRVIVLSLLEQLESKAGSLYSAFSAPSQCIKRGFRVVRCAAAALLYFILFRTTQTLF
ncbi:unnamed protein product [Phaeothamnion confervicola]